MSRLLKCIAECRHAKCRYAECRNAKYRGATWEPAFFPRLIFYSRKLRS
jgi:hypothetical protein